MTETDCVSYEVRGETDDAVDRRSSVVHGGFYTFNIVVEEVSIVSLATCDISGIIDYKSFALISRNLIVCVKIFTVFRCFHKIAKGFYYFRHVCPPARLHGTARVPMDGFL